MEDRVHRYRAGVVVPRDAKGIIVDRSVTELDDKMFAGYEELEWVELHQGVRLIGRAAFFGCSKLKEVRCWPSSLIAIGNQAFAGCGLSVLILPEGLRLIGSRAFHGCDQLRWVAVPSSVVEIGFEAFHHCDILREVTLMGGMVLVRKCAFAACPLDRIQISSLAIVVEDARAEVVTTGEIERKARSVLILASPRLIPMSSADVARVANAIDRTIAGQTTRGAGRWNVEGEGVAHGIRTRFCGLLAAHRRAVASILERGLQGSGTDLPGETRAVVWSFLDGI